MKERTIDAQETSEGGGSMRDKAAESRQETGRQGDEMRVTGRATEQLMFTCATMSDARQ
jgi:hypothetical protein